MKPPRRPPPSRQSGFSLLELTVTLALFSVLVGSLQLGITQRLVDDLERDQAEQVAGEVHRLANAAQHYAINEGEWPLETLLCEGAYAELETDNLLKGAPRHSPYLNSAGNRTEYVLSCDARHFTVTTTTESAEQATGLVRRIPGSSASGTTVAAHYPKPADAGGGDGDDDDDDAEPTAGTLDLGNQFLFGARDVVTDTGQTLLNSVQFATVARSGELIRKPTCLAGMTPRIFTALNQVSVPSGRALHGIQLPVDNLANSWRVRAVITGSDGDETPTSSTAAIAVFTKCSY